jgi:hypothetical protein
MTAQGMVAENVQSFSAALTLAARCWAREVRFEEREAKAKLEGCPEIVAGQAQTEAGDWWGLQPVARVSHGAGQQQVLHARTTACFDIAQNCLMALVGQKALHV